MMTMAARYILAVGLCAWLTVIAPAATPAWGQAGGGEASDGADPATAAGVGGEPVLVDRIVAIVDEEMILQSDIDQEVEQYVAELQFAGQEAPEITTEIRQEMYERLVEAKLIVAAAKQADMTVDQATIRERVEARVSELIKQYGSEDNLRRAMLNSGITLEDYRERAAAQLTDIQYLQLVVSRFIRPQVEIMENEVEQYYEAHRDELPAVPDSLTVSQILLLVQPSPEVQAAVQDRVADAQQALLQGQAFADVARAFSQGPNAARGGEIGVVKRGDLFDRVLEATVFELDAGEVSQPVVSSRGVHIIRLDAILERGRAISQVFFPMDITEADVARVRERIEQARHRVESGEPFSRVAGDMSDDVVSARNGGLLGTFQFDQLSPQFQEVLATVATGQLTEPLLTAAGWYLFLVNERRPGRSYELEEVRDDLRRLLENERLEQKVTEYVESLRERFFIDEKI